MSPRSVRAAGPAGTALRANPASTSSGVRGTAAPQTAPRDLAGTAGIARYAAPATAAVVFVALVALTWAAWGDLRHDTGYDFVAADRLAHGDLPYADFSYLYGPLGVGLLGGAFALLGTSVGVAVGVGLALAAAAVALTYHLGRALAGPVAAAVAAVLAAPAALGTGNVGLVVPHSISASVAVVAALSGLSAAYAHAGSGTRRSLVATGVAVGAVALTRPEFLAAIACAVALWLGLRWWRADAAGRPRALRDALIAIGSAAVLPVVVYGAAAAAAGAGTLRDDLAPSSQLAAGGKKILEATAPLTAGSFAKLLGHTLLYGVLIAAILGAAALAHRRPKLRPFVLAGAALVVAGLVVVALDDPEAARSKLEFAFSWIPAGAAIAVVALLAGARHRDRAWDARGQLALLVCAFTAVLAAKTYAAFLPQPNPDFAQYATYALPFAALFLVWLHAEAVPRGDTLTRALGLAWVGALAAVCCVLVAHDARDESVTVRGPGGALHAGAADGPAYQAAVDAVVARSRPGEPVLFAPQMSALYTIADRTDPLPTISLLPGALPAPADETAAIEHHLGDVRVAVTDRRPLTEYGQGAFGTTYDQRLMAWLRSDFRIVATVHGQGQNAETLDVWQRKPS
ncbi:hypothetical protein DSM104299_04576 [Baekduia alba]|uniref:hypothetical protein n=1 Tax=Baekduia alba TaxID=2997333 RepID=UPI0023409E5B|nr:hypothetical protein [Baekduia alba]WCB95825.1 hypothetical protein DSM104299_04576 [Baekduia alba]